MRVLQLSKFYPPVMGGIESVAWELAEGLHRLGVHTEVLCSSHRWRSVHQTTKSGHRVVRAGTVGSLLSTSIAPPMPQLLRRMARAADVIHLHMPDPMAAAAFWVARPRARLVVHWHSDVIRQRMALRAYEPLQQWLLGRADAIVATSRPYAEASAPLRQWRHKVQVVPIGISDDRPAACSLKAAALRRHYGGRRIVFSLGRMTYYKGFDVLIDAAAALPDDCVVLIGGDGELLADYRARIAARGLSAKVHLLGHVKDAELASHFEACDVFCMPSTVRAEAYGVAMLEAMLMAKPIVAANIPGSGVPWVNVHGQTGLNVAVRDTAALAAALQALVSDETLRHRFGAAARRRYEEEFRAEMMVQRMLVLYRGLLGG
ncbi:MAG TPA: glycosyltransferase [Rubrivivax sp.]|nr:glycosyltransferase [Rubrivivax sp.]